jgi:ABC-type bacteriocin/lantibiotic exporter with double-glycine peptidase domain
MSQTVGIKFLKYLKPYWLQESLLLLLLLVANALALASPYALKLIIDDVFPNHNYQLLLSILGGLIAIYVIRILSAIWSDYLFAKVSNRVMLEIRMDVFSHVTKLPITFFGTTRYSDIVHRVNNEVEKVQSILTGSVIRLINNLFTIAALVIMLAYMNFHLFLISIVLFPLALINIGIFHKKLHLQMQTIRSNDANILSFFNERFSSILLIKCFNGYKFEMSSLKKLIERYIASDVSFTLTSSISRNITSFLVALAPLVVLLYGGSQVLSGVMSLGVLVAFIQYLNKLFPPLRDLMTLYTDLMKAFVSMARIMELMDEREENDQSSTLPPSFTQNLLFRDVAFTFSDSHRLQHLSAVFSAGKVYGLVGASGSGKSTMVKLALGLGRPEAGEILVDGIPLDRVSMFAWRSKVAFVNQDTLFYHSSIIENLSYGLENVSFDSIKKVCEITEVHDHITTLGNGYETLIGDRGAKLSNGQQQRLMIARALLKNFDLLVLDEATSALDSESEERLLTRIYRAFPHATVIIVTHRLSTLISTHEIKCLKDGKITEFGSMNELVQMQGDFFNLFKDQLAVSRNLVAI